MFRGFQLATNLLQSFALVEVVEVRSRSCGKGRENYPRLGLLRGLLSLAAARFIIVAANENGFVWMLTPYNSRNMRQIDCRKSHKDRTFTGKMNTGSGGIPLADNKRMFRLALDKKISAGNSSTSEKAFLSIGEYALQA